MHKLYLLLRDCLPEKEEPYLIDEIENMVDRMDGEKIIFKAIKIMYPKKNINKMSSMGIFLLFIQGLKQHEFFEYANFINGIKRDRRTSKI